MNKGRVNFLSEAIKISRKLDSVLDSTLVKILADSQKSVQESFTKNFSAKMKPIDSGQLRASIKRKVTGNREGEIYTDKHYAPHVEYGTIKMKARPFFRKGITDVEQKNLNTIKYALRTKLK